MKKKTKLKANLDKFGLKRYFIGISIGPSSQNDTGIALLNENLELLRIDKAFSINDIKLLVRNLGYENSSVVCVDLPRNATLLNGKWRVESKQNQTFKIGATCLADQDWTNRFGDRGSDLCNTLIEDGRDVFRHNGFFTKNALNIIPPFKSRSPAACKYLQMLIKDKLLISGIPSNMIPLSGLDAIIAAYTAYKIAAGKENETYKFIGDYKNLQVVSAL